MMEHDHVRKRMYTRMCAWVTLLDSRNLTEHGKQAMVEKINIILEKETQPLIVS